MELKQIQEVAAKYRKMLPAAEVVNDERICPRPLENFRHCAWMCDKIISGEFDQDKAMRWLCFVQGCLWSLGVKTINEMKDDNRSPLSK